MDIPPPPEISVVIASVNGFESLGECLENLEREIADFPAAEILVYDRCLDDTAARAEARFPFATIRHFGSAFSVPKLRGLAMAEAKGAIVVVIEDHCMVAEGWLRTIDFACRESADCGVIGGAVENGSPERLMDRAVFLCEYSFSMLPLIRGVADGVTGNNVCYRREVLVGQDRRLLEDRWEYFLHQKLREDGVRFFCAPEIVVYHRKEFGFGYFMAQRFHYSRSFSAMRAVEMSLPRRIVQAAATPLLPLLILRRMASQSSEKGQLGEFVRCLPLLLLFMVSYAVGEAAGSLLGAGKSLEEVE